MEKHYSCINTRAIIEYFQERFPERLPELLEGLGPEIEALEHPREFLLESHNWVSSGVVIRMFENARRITQDDQIAYELGFQAAACKKLGYVQRLILFAYKNPRRALRRLQDLNDKFNRNKFIEVDLAGDLAIIRLHWFPDVPGSLDFCLFNQGIYSGLPTVWNLPPASVRETRCYFRGDDYCEYHYQWQKKSWLWEFLSHLSSRWSIVRSTIRELERDKELLKQKFEEVHRLNLQMHEKITQLICLQECSTAALSLLKQEDILQVGLKLLIRFTKLERALVLLSQEGKEGLEACCAAGVAPGLWQEIRSQQVPLAELITKVTSRGGAAILSLTPEPEPSGANRLLRQLRSQALILAPINIRGRTLGVVLADGRPAAAINQADKEFLAVFANQLAIALENARLYGELEASERKYRELVENAHEGIWIVANDGRIQFANRRMQEILGEEGLEGREFREFCGGGDLAVMEGVLEQNRQGQAAQVELALTSRNRGQVAVQISSVPWLEDGNHQGSFAMFSDISSQKEMERQLRQRQKMEAVGTLAGGIAHNFNNLLMNIMGLTGLILAHTGVHDPAYGDLKQIEQEVIKGSALTRQLLSFGRGEEFRPQPLDLNHLVARTAKLFCRTHAEIVCSQSLTPELPAVEADAGQLEQVLLNLLVNAWQAMSGRGELVLTTEAVWLTEDFCRPEGRPPGRYLHLSLADSGSGIDQAIAPRIFEPFYTTKEMAQGTGLGLATVYAIIKNHRGLIQVQSELGRGTTFHLYLPVSAKPAATEIFEKSSDSNLIRGSGMVLLVDDDDGLRRVGTRLLEQLGYQVLAAADGPQALSLYQAQRDRVDLIILDLIMPGMSGWETYQQLKEIDPRVRVLLSSGSSSHGETQQLLKAGVRGFIQKPYRIGTLSQTIAKILGPGRE